LIPAPP